MSLPARPRILCLLCQYRSFSTSYRRLAEQAKKTAANTKPTVKPAAPTPSTPDSPFQNAPRSYGERVEKFTPVPLPRPIGMVYPPELGQNTGIDNRSIRQRRDDFVDWEKHLVRREELKTQFRKPYFRDWSNLSFHKGKTFIAPPRPFKGDLSLWFPNLYGTTLLKADRSARDTTPVLFGKVSVVSVFSGQWAEGQAKSFASPEGNPELEAVLAAAPGRAQHVRINVEEDGLKAMLIRLFLGRLRRAVGQDNWDKYFVVRRGLSREICEAIGILNSKVGYVYLVDADCRIRWAGSGYAEDHEKTGMVGALRRLLDEDAARLTKGDAAAATATKKAPTTAVAEKKKKA